MKLLVWVKGGMSTITERFPNSAELMVPLVNSSVMVLFRLKMVSRGGGGIAKWEREGA